MIYGLNCCRNTIQKMYLQLDVVNIVGYFKDILEFHLVQLNFAFQQNLVTQSPLNHLKQIFDFEILRLCTGIMRMFGQNIDRFYR